MGTWVVLVLAFTREGVVVNDGSRSRSRVGKKNMMVDNGIMGKGDRGG